MNYTIKSEVFAWSTNLSNASIISIDNVKLENETNVKSDLSCLFEYNQKDVFLTSNITKNLTQINAIDLKMNLKNIFSMCDWFKFKIEKLFYGQSSV